ncbi:hypothetical protein PoB_003393200 [Plakobranchus ocellatus]|uniref:SERTA domain-containing protein n=1 Tax=Plakobranchus ocellatus TaxID=259542 RepID=A0AAV4AKB1_9GAST|nr:hypothetical protein PoB_003393200 [Plakobranchus ocellatus]
MPREQTSSTKCSPTWEMTSIKEVKERVENRRRVLREAIFSNRKLLNRSLLYYKTIFALLQNVIGHDKKNIPYCLSNFRFSAVLSSCLPLTYCPHWFMLWKSSNSDGNKGDG